MPPELRAPSDYKERMKWYKDTAIPSVTIPIGLLERFNPEALRVVAIAVSVYDTDSRVLSFDPTHFVDALTVLDHLLQLRTDALTESEIYLAISSFPLSREKIEGYMRDNLK